MPSQDICGVREKAFSRAPPGPTREPDQEVFEFRAHSLQKEWRRTNFVTFLRLIFERVGTIDIAWEWLRDSYLCVGIQLKPFGHALAWNAFNANQSRFRFFRQTPKKKEIQELLPWSKPIWPAVPFHLQPPIGLEILRSSFKFRPSPSFCSSLVIP
ncbi:hypothetical protein C8R43DRAFT_1111439 [Mycena crocata]|nr:hypothetical protein C8R43DRAFT_1111439 [Mycena crocata]